MTHAELLRKHATDAANEGGIWFSGEYMGMLADFAESIEAENAKLRELLSELYQCSRQYGCDWCGYRDGCAMFDRMAQLGVEVDR